MNGLPMYELIVLFYQYLLVQALVGEMEASAPKTLSWANLELQGLRAVVLDPMKPRSMYGVAILVFNFQASIESAIHIGTSNYKV